MPIIPGQTETEQCKRQLREAKHHAESVAVITDKLAQEFLKVINCYYGVFEVNLACELCVSRAHFNCSSLLPAFCTCPDLDFLPISILYSNKNVIVLCR